MPQEEIRQITGTADGRIWLLFEQTSTGGIFDPVRVTYKKVPIVTSGKIPPRAEYNLWTDSRGNIYLNVNRYGKVLKFDKVKFEFIENTPLNNLPTGWKTTINIFEDTLLNRFWILADSGLCIYDGRSAKTWSRHYNPLKIKLLDFFEAHHVTSEFFIDQQRRHWYYWTSEQHFACFDEQRNP